MDTEEWATVPEYPNYEVSSQGRVRNKSRGRYLTPSTLKGSNFRRVALHKNGYPKYVGVHRIVARAFMPNFDDRYQVELIDPDQGDGVDNLKISMRSKRPAEEPFGEPTSHQLWLEGMNE